MSARLTTELESRILALLALAYSTEQAVRLLESLLRQLEGFEVLELCDGAWALMLFSLVYRMFKSVGGL